MDISRRAFMGTVAGAGFGIAMSRTVVGQDAKPPEGSRLEHIDCTQDLPPERYFADGATQVVESSAGRYREAEARPRARFGYRFSIKHVGRPHVAVIRYPDDKRRFMCINDGTCYDLTTGVFTGWEQPISGKMIELRQVFWPRWNDCSVVFMTWSHGEPAAVSSIEIWELDELAPLSVPGDPNDGSRREIGIQYEDPCGTGASEGARTHDEWIDHVTQYAQHTGQKLLTYPMAWYHGPHYPSDIEPCGAFECVVAADRKQYSRWTLQPGDFYDRLLQRMSDKGLQFQGALTLMRLGSLMEGMYEAKGADMYNNMMWNNQMQTGTNDWTWLYNVRNFETIAEYLKTHPATEPHKGLAKWAYGERPTPGSHMAPIFNPLHPTVQKAILRFVGEIGQKYGKYPAFQGISFNMFASCMPWFGSIHAGYDDFTIGLFAQETGISAYVDSDDSGRFAKRYEYLTFTCRSAWVEWRCRKIRELFGRIQQALSAARPGLRVTITLWDETTVPGVLGQPSPASQYEARPSMRDFYRDAGIDLDLYRDCPGLGIDLGIGNPRDRGGHGGNPCGGTNLPIESTTMYRDYDYLDHECLEAMHGLDKPGAFIFNCWVEAWGRHIWFTPEEGDPNVAQVALMDGKPADGILRMNSEYPKDGFWWDSQLRITPPFPSGVHFLEPYAHAVAELDACRITRGGLFLDKAHSGAIRRFAQAYRALPNVKFETVGATTDPVAVRTLVHDGVRYVYAINRDYYPVDVNVTFDKSPAKLRDLATGTPLAGSKAIKFVLGPYALQSLALEPGLHITGFAAAAPPAIVEAITADTQKALGAFKALREAGKYLPGMDALQERTQSALAEGRIAFLRRALTSYLVRKAHELTVSA